MNKYSVGDLIYKKRKEKNLTQSQLGEMLGVSNKAVSKWETGESFPEFSLIQPLCEILGISADELISGKEKEDCKNSEINSDNKQTESKREEFETTHFDEMAQKQNPTQKKQLSPAGKAFEKRFFVGIAIAVFLCVASLGGLFLAQYYGMKEEYSVCVLLSTCAVAVFMFVHLGMKYDAYNKNISDNYVNDIAKFTWILPIGVLMCIFSPCIILLFEGASEGKTDLTLALCLFFVWVAIAVFIFVFSGMHIKRINDAYGVIKDAKQEQWQDRACGVVMMVATIIYLILGFVCDLWHPSWVIFPIGGIICGILGATKKNDHK